jgi:hypothetical protein
MEVGRLAMYFDPTVDKWHFILSGLKHGLTRAVKCTGAIIFALHSIHDPTSNLTHKNPPNLTPIPPNIYHWTKGVCDFMDCNLTPWSYLSLSPSSIHLVIHSSTHSSIHPSVKRQIDKAKKLDSAVFMRQKPGI